MMKHTKTNKMMKRLTMMAILMAGLIFTGQTVFGQGKSNKLTSSFDSRVNNQITENSVRKIKVGMSVGDAKKLLGDVRMYRDRDSGYDTIEVSYNSETGAYKTEMVFIVEPSERKTPAKDDSAMPDEEIPINNNLKILGIDTSNSKYKTSAGVNPQMSLEAAEKLYGKVKLIFKVGFIRKTEYVIFTNHPTGVDFSVALADDKLSLNNGRAGIYPEDADIATKYSPDSIISAVQITGRYDDLLEGKSEYMGKSVPERLRIPYDAKTQTCRTLEEILRKRDKPNINNDIQCWKGRALSGDKNLKNAILGPAYLSGTDFSNADMHGSMFFGSELRNVNFTGSDLVGVNLFFANLEGADLTNANLQGADLQGAKLKNATLTGAILEGTNLSDQDLSKMNLAGTNFTRANFNKANLSEAILTSSFFAFSNLEDANLTGAKLSEADFGNADLSGTNFTKADLTNATFQRPKLNKTIFTDSNLTGADLQYADLTTAKLNGAIVTGATVSKSNTKGIDLEDWKKRGGIVVD